jgi:glycosyltransferase involved in cell wall biosynthesis
MREPLISVIVCVRDGEKYLREALDSVANQGVSDLEVIVVDDGSTDASTDIATAHPISPQILSQAPLGYGAAFNRGLRTARGHLLASIDSDDVWPQGRLKPMLSVMAQDSSADFVYGRVANTDEQLNPTGPALPARLAGAMVFRRVVAPIVGDLRADIGHGAFVDWCGRAITHGFKFVELDLLVLLRRGHGANMGSRDRLRARADLLRVVRDHVGRIRR